MKILFLMALGWALSASADSPPVKISAPSLERLLKPYNDYLNTLFSLKATFEQIDSKGRKCRGMLYLLKPGRLRLIYYPVGTLQVIADGKRLIQYDGQTQDSQSMALEQSPLAFLLRPHSRLQEATNILQVVIGPQWSQIILTSKEDPEAGTIKLIFRERPVRTLVRWTITDGRGNHTMVTLSGIESNCPLDPKIFEMKRSTP